MKKIVKILLIIFLSFIIMLFNSINVQAARQDMPTMKDEGSGFSSTEYEANTIGPEDVVTGASDFINAGAKEENPINMEGLQNVSSVVYNILLTVGIIAAVIIGLFIGIKYMTGSVSERAETKQLIAPYIVGCVVVFGAFTIWRIVVEIINKTQ